MPASHRTAEPAMYTCPSRQYVVPSPSRHTTDADSPAPDRFATEPVVTRRNAPVPYVHLASPAARHPSARSAACWSTAIPVIGSGRPNAAVSPANPAQSATAGSAPASRPNAAKPSRTR